MGVDLPLQRALYLFVGYLFLALFVQVTLYHWRQNFRHWAMWVPVIATPLLGVAAILFYWFDGLWLRAVLGTLGGVGVLSGAVGSYYHFVGIGRRVDGYNINNFMVGPPPALPGLITVLSLLVLFGLYIR